MLWALILVGWSENGVPLDAGRWVRISRTAYRARRAAGEVGRATIPSSYRGRPYGRVVTPEGVARDPVVAVEVEIPWHYEGVRYGSGDRLEVPLEVWLRWRGSGFIVRANVSREQRRRDRGCGGRTTAA